MSGLYEFHNVIKTRLFSRMLTPCDYGGGASLPDPTRSYLKPVSLSAELYPGRGVRALITVLPTRTAN
jgi:hypothetical protein